MSSTRSMNLGVSSPTRRGIWARSGRGRMRHWRIRPRPLRAHIPLRVGEETPRFMLRVDDITRDYRSQRVLDGASLVLKPRERAALVAPDGAGTSTLLT